MNKINKKITVNDKMQKTHYYLTEEIGKNFHSDFTPDLSPKELLALGIFAGKYMTDCRSEFPASWFEKAKLATDYKDINLNYYKIDASMPLKHWEDKGWINPVDPRGWFQWYCRYYYGRRLEDEDLRQIKRWRAMKRHVGAIKKNCKKQDLNCRKKQRQALLHWAYDSRKI